MEEEGSGGGGEWRRRGVEEEGSGGGGEWRRRGVEEEGVEEEGVEEEGSGGGGEWRRRGGVEWRRRGGVEEGEWRRRRVVKEGSGGGEEWRRRGVERGQSAIIWRLVHVVNKSSNRTSEKVGGGRGTCQCIHIQHMCRYTVLTVQCIQVIIQSHPHSIHIPTH